MLSVFFVLIVGMLFLSSLRHEDTPRTVAKDSKVSEHEIDPNTLHEDQRAAAGMAATLSGLVMSSALAVLAGLATFAVLLLKKSNGAPRLPADYCWWICAMFAVMALVSSIILGGKGIARLYNSGFAGRWDYGSAKDNFELQTVLCLLGLILTLFAVVAGLLVGRQEEVAHGSRDLKPQLCVDASPKKPRHPESLTTGEPPRIPKKRKKKRSTPQG